MRSAAAASLMGCRFRFFTDSGLGELGEVGPLGNGWNHKFRYHGALPDSERLGRGHGHQLANQRRGGDCRDLFCQNILLTSSSSVPASLDRIIVAAQLQRWLMDQLENNMVSVTTPGAVERFTQALRRTDKPGKPGIQSAARLFGPADAAVSGSFNYKTKPASSPSTRPAILRWSRPSGASVTFGYNATPQLTSVTNTATNGQLTFVFERVVAARIQRHPHGGSATSTTISSASPQIPWRGKRRISSMSVELPDS